MKKPLGYTSAVLANLFLLVYIMIGIASRLTGFIEYWLGLIIAILLDLTLIDIDYLLRRKK